MLNKTTIIGIIFFTFLSPVYAQEDESVWKMILDSITVSSYRYNSKIKITADGDDVWNLSEMTDLPQILSNADPVHYAQMLPGIQTNSEYHSGLNIEGCDNQHNMISINGIPLYNVHHLLGFFSTFNTSHFDNMSLSRGAVSSSFPNRIGGQLDMHHCLEFSDSMQGSLSLGLVSSNATVKCPLSRNTSLSVSLRDSYLNLLYSKWLKADELDVKYSFFDVNATITHQPNKNNLFVLDFYKGRDVCHFNEVNYLSDMKADWGNNMFALHWIYNEKGFPSVKSSIYTSSYQNKFTLAFNNMNFELPSSIMDVGVKSEFSFYGLSGGFESVWHNIKPQSLKYRGELNLGNKSPTLQKSLESSFFCNYHHSIIRNLDISVGVRGVLFEKSHYAYTSIDPSFRLLYDNSQFNAAVTYSFRHQYLYKIGFSDFGLPTDFWLSSTVDAKPQYAHELSLRGGCFLFNNRLRITMSLFWKELYNQLAYKGSVLDMANTIYDSYNSLFHGNGENYGFSILIDKCTGRFTGWVSYTYSCARRKFTEISGNKFYPASHERPHELNVLATYKPSKHLSLGGVMVFASGTPFTPAKSIYFLNNNLIVKYGDYNSSRLSPYFRVDVSASYSWQTRKRKENGVNFSVYNIGCFGNELYYYLRTKKDGSFAYRPIKFIVNMLPSLSYYYKF